MNDASDSGNGIGLSQNDAASHISSLLDSDLNIATTAEDSDVENETDEVSQPSDDAIETSDERTLEDSEELVEAEEDAAVETADPNVIKLSDDMVFEVDGQKVTGFQLRDERMIKAEFTRKTQELAEARRGVDVQVNQIRDQSAQWFQNMEREVAMHLPQEPNWAQLAQDDPAEYVAQKEQWAARHALIGRLRQERAAVEQQQAEIQEAEHQRAMAEGQKRLAEMHPELAKPETGKAKALGDYLVNAGIPAEAIGREVNPVLFSIAFKAMQFDQLQAQKAKAVKVVDEKPLLATPGSSPARSNNSQSVVERKMSALKRTGSQAAAADVLKHLL